MQPRKVLTKNEAIKKLGKVKAVLTILNEIWPNSPLTVKNVFSGKTYIIKVIPAPTPSHFFAYFDSINGIFWIGCLDHWIWSSDEYEEVINECKEAADEQGFSFNQFFAPVVSFDRFKREAANRKDMFLCVPANPENPEK